MDRPPVAGPDDAQGSLLMSTTRRTTTSSSASPPPIKRRRAASSSLSDCCRTCRLRKVKCTGNPGNGPCTNCARLDLACPFTSPDGPLTGQAKVARTTPSHSHTEAGTLRKRAQRACSQCHAHKTKCSGDLPRCRRCEAGGLSCEYLPAKRKFAAVRFNTNTATPKPEEPEPDPSPPTEVSAKKDDQTAPSKQSSQSHFPLAIETSSFTTEEILFRKDIILRHFDAYMEYFYFVPSMGFLHPETTYQQIHDGTLHPATAAAMVAVASFFVNPSEAGREFALKCSDEVEFYVFRNIYRFAEDTLILYALNGAFNFLNGSLAKVWQCIGIAVRLMLGLQVNWDVPGENRTFAQQECLRRIAWHFFYIDRVLAGGYEEYISCRDESMKLPLPCSEVPFRANTAVVVERLHDRPGKLNSAIGLHGFQLRLIDIRHRILCLNRKFGVNSNDSRSRVEPSKIMSEINALQNDLSRFNASLPSEYKLSDHNIARYLPADEGPGYVFLHCCLSASHVDLYSASLPGLREQISLEALKKMPHEFVVKSQKQAVAHALCLARFCDVIQRHVDQRPITDKPRLAGEPSILTMTTRCLRVLLVALQHNFYQDLADHTTAPLWRSEPADEPHIRGLINSLLRISESWCQIIPSARHLHESNKDAIAQFDKTRKFAEQRTSGPDQGFKVQTHTPLPGPHHILESAFMGPLDEDKRKKSGDAAAAARWFQTTQQTPQPAREPVPYSFADGRLDVECSPPGVPMFLAQARGVPPGTTETINMFDAANDLLSMSGKIMPGGEFGSSLIPTSSQLGLPSDAIPLVQMDNSGDSSIYTTQTPTTQPQFMHPPHNMFMEGYGQYAGSQNDSTSYMPQNGFG